MAYKAHYDLVLPSFSDLIFTSLLYHGSHYYGLPNSHFLPFLATEFWFFFMVSIFPVDITRLIQGNYEKSLLSKPTSLLDGWLGGGCLWTIQANNAKLNFARGFLRRFSLSLSCWKEVIHLAHWSFHILSAMNIDIISGTIAAILWPWRKDLQNYRDVDSNYLASEPVSYLYHSNTINSTTSQPGLYTCSPQAWNSFFLYHHMAGSSSCR